MFKLAALGMSAAVKTGLLMGGAAAAGGTVVLVGMKLLNASKEKKQKLEGKETVSAK